MESSEHIGTHIPQGKSMTTRTTPLFETVQNLRTGHPTLLDYIQQTCAWINIEEPTIQALVPEPNREERLMHDAYALLQRYPDPDTRPPLFGALIGVKDIFIADGFPMHAGSRLPADAFTGKQASSVSKLLAAGAIILGKTVTTEFAYFAPGPTRNPHNPTHTPGGSSSGSAAAVAAGMCGLSLGTQTIGSVIRPAAYCGVYGFKPTFGKIKTDGVLPCSQTVDHIGFFTQDIDGIALAASVLIHGWKGLPDSLPTPCIGVPEGPYLQQADEPTLAAFHHHVQILKDTGLSVKHFPLFSDIETINRHHKNIVAAEFAMNHAVLYQQYSHLYAGQSRELFEKGLAISEDELHKALEMQRKVRQRLYDLMRREGIHCWICPSSKTPAPVGLSSTGDPIMNLPWTFAGLPALAVPAGIGEDKLPLSMQLVANFNQDEQLLSMAKLISGYLKDAAA
jgi:Asp-tRNA(Asn)/Glu-tRNA(Gln) amidotransferase A subunit family amidase